MSTPQSTRPNRPRSPTLSPTPPPKRKKISRRRKKKQIDDAQNFLSQLGIQQPDQITDNRSSKQLITSIFPVSSINSTDISTVPLSRVSSKTILSPRDGDFILDQEKKIFVPASIASRLFQYQKEGVQWLYNQVSNAQGCILGDEMGLGKTIQIIALLSALFNKSGIKSQDRLQATISKERQQFLKKFREKVERRIALRKKNFFLAKQTDLQSNESNNLTSNQRIQLSRAKKQQKTSRDSDTEFERASIANLRRTNSRTLINFPTKTALIISPASVLYQWESEIQEWSTFHIGIAHDTHRQFVLDNWSSYEIILCTYAAVRDHTEAFEKIPFTLVIMDECHKIKNPLSKAHKGAKKAFSDISIRVGLTGTVMQNNFRELWCLLDFFTNGDRFFTYKRFSRVYGEPIKKGQRIDASPSEIKTCRTRSIELSNEINQFILHREKSILRNKLTKKHDKVVFCPLSETQIDLYQKIIQSEDFRLILSRTEMCPCDSGLTRSHCCFSTNMYGKGGAHLTFSCMAALIKVCNDPRLLLPLHTDSIEKQQKDKRLCELAWNLPYDRILSQLNSLPPSKCSSKLATLAKLLAIWKQNGDKVLIFSRSTRQLHLIEDLLKEQGFHNNFLRFDGSTKIIDRQQIVSEFNTGQEEERKILENEMALMKKQRSLDHKHILESGSQSPRSKLLYKQHLSKQKESDRLKLLTKTKNLFDPNYKFILLVSTLSGAYGLNIQAANRVCIFDPNWNPSHDTQATDRAYRFGQTRNVNVYRFICSGSIEENMYQRQIYKNQHTKMALLGTTETRYFNGIAGDPNYQGELFGVDNLFSFDTSHQNRTQNLLLRSKIVEKNLKETSINVQDLIKDDIRDNPDSLGLEEFDSSSEENQKVSALSLLNQVSKLSVKAAANVAEEYDSTNLNNSSKSMKLSKHPIIIDMSSSDEDEETRVIQESGIAFATDHSRITLESAVEKRHFRKLAKNSNIPVLASDFEDSPQGFQSDPSTEPKKKRKKKSKKIPKSFAELTQSQLDRRDWMERNGI